MGRTHRTWPHPYLAHARLSGSPLSASAGNRGSNFTLAHLFNEVPDFAGHTATDRAARTPYLDIFVSPAEYDGSRRTGGHLWSHNLPDSLRLHNKLFVYEADTRTYLADIEPKQYSLQETLEVLKHDAAAALLRGSEGEGRILVWLYAPGLAQPGRKLSPVNVERVLGMRGLRLLNQPTDPTLRFTDMTTPVTTGLPLRYELAPRYFQPKSLWRHNSNALQPFPYLDPAQATGIHILGEWVIGGEVRPDMGAFALRKLPDWTSVYSACPYLSIEIMLNLTRMAGVHIYLNANDILICRPSLRLHPYRSTIGS